MEDDICLRMKKNTLSSVCLLAVTTWYLTAPFAEARVGGGRSSGSRGSRGSASSSPYRSSGSSSSNNNAYRSTPQQAPSSSPQAPQGGGFMRNFGAGLLGGAVGSMLFGGGNRGWGGGGGGGGIGLLEILLFAGLAFAAFKFFKSRQQSTAGGPSITPTPFSIPPNAPVETMNRDTTADPVDVLAASDPGFNLTQFNGDRLDDFFRLQAAWATRDITPVQSKLTGEMFNTLSQDAAALKQKGQINKLDNIAMRSSEIVEAWEEPGRVFVTVLFTANLVDYTVNETTNEVVAGSKTEPVKFTEAWTFTKDIGYSAQNPQWRLSAIEQQA